MEGFSSCFGVPRHQAFISTLTQHDPTLIPMALRDLGNIHDRLLDIFEDVAEEVPFVALRLLHVCCVSHFGHIISAVPNSQLGNLPASTTKPYRAPTRAPGISVHTYPANRRYTARHHFSGEIRNMQLHWSLLRDCMYFIAETHCNGRLYQQRSRNGDVNPLGGQQFLPIGITRVRRIHLVSNPTRFLLK